MQYGKGWLSHGFDMWTFGTEAATVMALRSLQIAGGGLQAQAESQRMVQEKIAAGFELHVKAMTGALGLTAPTVAKKTIAHYRRKVRANRKRLLSGK